MLKECNKLNEGNKMKNWKMGTKTTMWACGTANLPEHKDTITDLNGKVWTVYVNGGYTLRDENYNPHHYIRNNESWHVLASWFNEVAQY